MFLEDAEILGHDYLQHPRDSNGIVPRFSKPLHVGCPNVGNVERFLDRVRNVFDSRCFTNDGDYVRELEAKMATFLELFEGDHFMSALSFFALRITE